MPYPTPIVEIAFNDGPYVVSPTWTDVTSYVRSCDIQRGVNDDWTLVADGSANVVLDNRDRRFDPFNASGPYYGKLLPRRQIRVRATYSGTTYDVFRGFISGWPPQWTDAGYDSTVTLSCFDALQLLGSSSLPADWARPYILSLNPRHYWPCDDPIRINTANQIIKDYGSFPMDMTTTAGVTQGTQIADGLVNKSIRTNWGNNFSTATFPAIAATDYTVTFWGVIDDGGISGYMGNTSWGFGINVFNGTYGLGVTEGGTSRTWTFTTQPNVSEPHHFAFTYNTTTKAANVYIDGVLTPTTLTSNASPSSTFEAVTVFSGSYQQICIWTSILTQTQIQQICTWSKAAFFETTAARFNRVVGESPFPVALQSPPSSPQNSVLGITDDAPTVSSELSQIANSEYAPLFVNKAGILTLYNQNQIRSQTKSIVSQVTYGSGGLPIGTEIQLQYDGDSMRNVANVEMSGGGVYILNNDSSITTYGEAEQYISTQVSTVPEADQIANIIEGWGGIVYPKASPISVVLSPNENWASTLGLELFERFTLAVAPKTGATITVPMLLSRISHSIVPGRWSTTVEGSARWAAVFVLNKSTLGGTDLLG